MGKRDGAGDRPPGGRACKRETAVDAAVVMAAAFEIGLQVADALAGGDDLGGGDLRLQHRRLETACQAGGELRLTGEGRRQRGEVGQCGIEGEALGAGAEAALRTRRQLRAFEAEALDRHGVVGGGQAGGQLGGCTEQGIERRNSGGEPLGRELHVGISGQPLRIATALQGELGTTAERVID